ncbi:HalOD1 output domain-containing protein [Natronorubrum sp. FCH18a]|uniref:HalOD1 output domain-containing protein n=1 Tax=Natronorubrum sp. FCH18a TaxID=3447018 RepID=UPI003F519B34
MKHAPVATTSTPYSLEPDTITEAVFSAVGDAERVSPLELQPLTTAIDPDALEALFRTSTGATTIEFDYHGYRVCVSSDERVTVRVYND